METKDLKSTGKRSFLGGIYKCFLTLISIDKKLEKASFQQLHAMEDTKTPVKKGYQKERTGEAVCWWIHKEKSSNGILVYLPGGGFVMGPLTFHWNYCALMSSKLNMAVMVIRYRLAPENPYPDGLNDIVNAVITQQKKGVINKKWYLGGDSAGGNLALAACYELEKYKATLPKKIILTFPSVDLSEEENDPELLKIEKKDVILSPAFAFKVKKAYVRNHDAKDPLLSPINGDLSVLPPVLLQHGSDDILVKGSRQFVEKMHEAGKDIQYEEFEGMYHGFTLSPGLPEAKRAIRSQVNFIMK